MKTQAHENMNALSEMIWPHWKCCCADTKLHRSRLSSKNSFSRHAFISPHIRKLHFVYKSRIFYFPSLDYNWLLKEIWQVLINLIFLHFLHEFSWCSGYHICLTHRRSPVRSRAKTCFPRGLTARISGFHPGGPGSTPGVGNFCFLKIV